MFDSKNVLAFNMSQKKHKKIYLMKFFLKRDL